MKIEKLSKLAPIILCASFIALFIGLFIWWMLIVGMVGLIAFELISAYIYEWNIEQEDEKY